MKIYVPTKITTEAEAEALPHGTKVFHDDMSAPTTVPYLYVKREDGSFVDWQGHILYLDEIVPCTALVPVEVKEVNVVAQGILEYDMNGRVVLEQANQPSARDYKRTEFHTAWRPA